MNIFYPVCHKHATFLSMIHRLVSAPYSSLSFEKERSIIQHIAKANYIKLQISTNLYTKNVFLVLSISLQLIHVLGRIGIGFVFRMLENNCLLQFLVFSRISDSGLLFLPHKHGSKTVYSSQRFASPLWEEWRTQSEVQRLPSDLYWSNG